MPSLYFRTGMNSADRKWRPRGGEGTTDKKLPAWGNPTEANLAISLVSPSLEFFLLKCKYYFSEPNWSRFGKVINKSMLKMPNRIGIGSEKVFKIFRIFFRTELESVRKRTLNKM